MKRNQQVILAIAMTLLVGCDSDDARLARMARDSVDQQRAQNEEMARLNREVAHGVQKMVESQGEARKEMTALQGDLQDQQASVATQRDKLDEERRALATTRYRESLLAPVLSSVGLLFVAALPLVLALYLLHGWRNQDTGDAAIGDLLVQEFVTDRPLLLPPSDRDHKSDSQGPPALSAPDDDTAGSELNDL